MGHSQYGDAGPEHAAWNAGKAVGTKQPFTQKQIWAIASSSIAKDAFATAQCSIWQRGPKFDIGATRWFSDGRY